MDSKKFRGDEVTPVVTGTQLDLIWIEFRAQASELAALKERNGLMAEAIVKLERRMRKG